MFKRQARKSGISLAAPVLTWGYAALLVIPLYFLIVSAFKDNNAIFNRPFALPTSLGFDNYLAAWRNAELGRGLLNSLIVTIGAEVLTLLLALPASYAIARAKGRIGRYAERFFALGLLLPSFAALVPTVFLAIALNLFHTREFVILFFPASVMPLTVILLTQFMRSVPAELEESAMLDGAGRFRILVNVYIPIVVPGIATVAILNFLSFWNEYLFVLILAGPTAQQRTAQVALTTLASQTFTDYGVLLAGALITMIPVYVVYIILNRRMEDALVHGAVKA